ncbi:protein kinase domain-containing protein [Acidicapsa acidisoli]|uniref:protein kinase domain-containing protein n=1 Tax=Acidicapsa acidisoli TaxID=1615681 RepID=UPI0021DF4776|nr:protein kinase [Acidicapsa acidisoli]
MKINEPTRLRLGAFELNLKTGELRLLGEDSEGRKVLLQEQPFRVLRFLIDCGGEVATREEIKRRLWPNDTIVDFDNSINVAIATLRRVFGDSAVECRYIETIPRRGYRLMVPVERVEPLENLPKDEPGNRQAEDGSQPQVLKTGLSGKKISHFRVLEVIGGGGMGVVYRAEDLKLGRRVALKFLPEELAGDPVPLRRFQREAETASSLNHPNICTIFEIEEFEGQPVIVMELLAGETLRDYLAAPGSNKVALDQLLEIALQTSSGLEAAHEKGIVHRDIKPANIFLTCHGQVKILDFGLAKLVESEEIAGKENGPTTPFVSANSQTVLAHDSTLSRTGAQMGTASYMSPEQIRKEKLDPRSDLFSFGLVLYEMTTGHRAFEGDSVQEVHQAILHRALGSTLEPKTALPRRLDTIISKALEKDRARRYQSAAEMHKDLLQLREELRPGRHLARKLLVVAASFLVIAAAGALYWRVHSQVTLAASDTLVLADMDNQTGDSALGDGMNLALQVSLQQTPYLYLLGTDKVRETLGMLHLDENGKITPQIALQVCRKTNSRAVISGFVADDGNRFRVGLEAKDCQSGRMLGRVANQAATRDDIVRTFGLSAFQLRGKLGESKDSLRKFNQPLDQATSSSPDALAFLASGYKRQLGGDIPSALGDYERALEKDPNFALAYAADGSGNFWLGKGTPASLGFSKAFDLRSRLTIPGRFQVETAYYGVGRNEWEKGRAIGEEWVHTFPRDVIARIDLGTCLKYLGRHNEALVQFRDAARLLPSNPTFTNLLVEAIFAQKFDEAKEAYDDAISRGLDSPGLHYDHALLAFLQNDKTEMQKEWAWASQDRVRGRYVLSMESKAEGFFGRSRNADRLTQIDAESSMKAGLSSDAADFENIAALREAENGNAEEAQLLAADALGKTQDRATFIFAALAFARAGKTEQAQKLVESISQRYPNDFSVQAFLLPCVRSAMKLSEKDPSAALTILQPVEPYDLAFNDVFQYAYPAYLRGVAYLQLKRGRLAADQFRKVLDHSGVGFGFVTGSLSVLQLARAQVLMHDSGAARKSYEDFLTLWKDADPDIPIYRQAKAEYAKLPKS